MLPIHYSLLFWKSSVNMGEILSEHGKIPCEHGEISQSQMRLNTGKIFLKRNRTGEKIHSNYPAGQLTKGSVDFFPGYGFSPRGKIHVQLLLVRAWNMQGIWKWNCYSQIISCPNRLGGFEPKIIWSLEIVLMTRELFWTPKSTKKC